MTTDNFTIYKRFIDLTLARETAAILKENGIEILIEDYSPVYDITFSGNQMDNDIHLKIKPSDFEKANQVLESLPGFASTISDKNYYLYSFSIEELYDVLQQSDEWNPYDVKLAEQILRDRGEHVSPELLESFREQRLKELEKPREGQRPWIIFGYISSLAGGILSIFIGYYIWKLKKTLPDGRKVYVYNAADRLHGFYIFIIGIVVFTLLFSLQVYSIIGLSFLLSP